MRDLLISVSSFFRDPVAFEGLTRFAPELFEGKGPDDAVRVWVVGCATGEEVYSLAMVLMEIAASLAEPPRLQVFATDIDEKGYAWGREGLYPAAAVANIGPERLRRFFTKETGGYRVAKSLRELVLFAGHNVLHDPPFSRIDLISCRNLFIYLQPEAQERVLDTFHFALNPGGHVIPGQLRESAGDRGQLFGAGSTGTPSGCTVAWGLAVPGDTPPVGGRSGGPGAGKASPGYLGDSGAGGGKIARRAAPAHAGAERRRPSAVVDERLDVVHLSAGAGRSLAPGGQGEPSNNLPLDLGRGELRSALRTALHQAFGKGAGDRPLVDVAGDGVARQRVSVGVRTPVVPRRR